MFGLILTLLIIDAVLLSLVVLLQAGQGGGLAAAWTVGAAPPLNTTPWFSKLTI